MPLSPGSSQAVKSKNIRELYHHGSRPRSLKQIVAIALDYARKHPDPDASPKHRRTKPQKGHAKKR